MKTSFLHGDLDETIYMDQPEGFLMHGSEDKIFLLKKSLYGLKQASRQWHLKFDEHMEKMGFEKSKYDSCIYFKDRGKASVVYLLLYVDDILISGPDKKELQSVKGMLGDGFEIKDLGSAQGILGMNISRDRRNKTLWLSQKDYIKKVVQKFQVESSKGASVPISQQFKLSRDQCPRTEAEEREMKPIPYANIVGSVMYKMICTLPDIAHAIRVASRYMSCPGQKMLVMKML